MSYIVTISMLATIELSTLLMNLLSSSVISAFSRHGTLAELDDDDRALVRFCLLQLPGRINTAHKLRSVSGTPTQ